MKESTRNPRAYTRTGRQSAYMPKPRGYTMVPCLGLHCRGEKMFPSENPKTNRICRNCKDSISQITDGLDPAFESAGIPTLADSLRR